MFGYAVEELREMEPEEYSANTHSFSPDAHRERLRDALDGNPGEFKWRIKRDDGELPWTRVHFSCKTRREEPVVLAEFRDISTFEINNRQLSLLSRIVRHNLRNETTVVNGYAEQIQVYADSERIRTFAERIQSTAMDLSRIHDSVKNIERSIKRDESQLRRTNVRTVVDSVVEAVGADYPAAEITVVEAVEMWVDVDAALAHALEHAVENAIVHNDRDDPGVRICIDESPNTGRVEIRIIDSGPRIPPVEIAATEDTTATTNTSHGSGVGLFVMKWCIESLGGELEIAKNTPRGNRVSFYLPPKKPPADGSESAASCEHNAS
jgi:PAS domain S-box-containing protein